ncbi:radical SAM protein [Fusobacterium sp. PH5-44]|uniref:radical SAM protein n=1 Tax=unclassified Fusobacterium TaxID=2648384 RepID=UPI003D1CB961
MRYEGAVFRPPSEANSLIIQLTIGCARNTCTFCYMYKDKKFRVRNLKEVVEDIKIAENYYPQNYIKRLFLADGDALIVKTEDLLYVINEAKKSFPEIERVSVYAAPKDILTKSLDDLIALKKAGLKLVYVGLESGDDQVLKDVKKGVTAAEMVEAGKKVKAAGMELSMMIISGLGGKPRLKEHAINSAKVISAIKPDFLGFLTLRFFSGTELNDDYQSGKFIPISVPEIMEEMTLFLKNVDSDGTIFRANHASNYLVLKGTLNKDREKLLKAVEDAKNTNNFRKYVELGF